MKTIKKLSIGDTLYKVYTDYRAFERPCFEKIKVERIEISEKENLIINQRSGYNSHNSFCHLQNECETDIIQLKDAYYTSNYNKVVILLKQFGLEAIKREELEMQKCAKNIEELRVLYWDYLNSNVNEPLLIHEKI